MRINFKVFNAKNFENGNMNNVSERWYVVCHTSSICGIEHWIQNEMDESFNPSGKYNRVANW